MDRFNKSYETCGERDNWSELDLVLRRIDTGDKLILREFKFIPASEQITGLPYFYIKLYGFRNATTCGEVLVSLINENTIKRYTNKNYLQT